MAKAKKTVPRKNDFFYYQPWDVNNHERGDMNAYLVFLGRYRVPLWLGLTSLVVALLAVIVVAIVIDLMLGFNGMLLLNVAIWTIFVPIVLVIVGGIVSGLVEMVRAWRKVVRGGSLRS